MGVEEYKIFVHYCLPSFAPAYFEVTKIANICTNKHIPNFIRNTVKTPSFQTLYLKTIYLTLTQLQVDAVLLKLLFLFLLATAAAAARLLCRVKLE